MFQFIVLSYNHPVITARCVSSALKLVAPEKMALLHNGSRPEHVESLRAEFPQIEHWVLPENHGYTAGVNEAFRRGFARAPWIFLLTNDTQLVRWDLPRLRDLTPGLYSPRVWLRKLGRVDYVGGLFDSARGKLTHLHAPLGLDDLRAGEYLYTPGTAFLLARETWEKLGPLDESLHMYWEDVDYGARATKLRVHQGFLPVIEVLHQGRKTTGKIPYYTSYLFQRNRGTNLVAPLPLALSDFLVAIGEARRPGTLAAPPALAGGAGAAGLGCGGSFASGAS